jgi:repressor LexA
MKLFQPWTALMHGQQTLIKKLSFFLIIWSINHIIQVKIFIERTDMEPLTDKQQKIFKFIESRLNNNDSPSQRQIAEHFGLAQNSVFQLVSYLKNKGYLVSSGHHRGLRLSKSYIEQISRTKGIPLVGKVAAGEPILAEQNIDQYVDLSELLSGDDGCFLLKVTGDSMVDEGIMDGDLVLVEPAAKVDNGRIGVVLIDDEATVKKIYFEKNRIALKPANKAAGYNTIYVKPGDKDIRIIGRVKGCFRLL